jgi:hypothetical protein
MRAAPAIRILLGAAALACGGADAVAPEGGGAPSPPAGGSSPVLTVTVHGPGAVELEATRTTPDASATSTMRCQGSCTVAIGPGASVVLTPSPAPGARFDGWSGACTGAGSCRFTIDRDRAVDATFAPRG